MTVTLTTQIAVPNIARWRVLAVVLNDAQTVAAVRVAVLNLANSRRREYVLAVRNGQCDTLRKNPTPLGFADDIEIGAELASATAYDQVEAAYRGGATKAAAFRAVEQLLLTLGLVSADLGGTVA